MKVITFIVNAAPVGKARARTVYHKALGRSISYTPEKTSDFESLVRWAYKEAGGEYMEKGEFSVSISAYYPVPSSWSNKKREMACRGEFRPKTTPDCDNIAKAVLDALNGVAFYDDSYVVQLVVKKWYATTPYVLVKVEKLREA